MATKNTKLAKQDPTPTAMQHQRESFIESSVSGTEDINANELRLPRLTLAQGISPQLARSDSQYIEDLSLGDMFNDMTGTVYGPGPLRFIAMRRDVRGIEFIPRSEGGGVRDLNVPLDEKEHPEGGPSRWTWRNGAGPEGKDLPPLATKFSEWVIQLLDDEDELGDILVLSIKDTNKFNKRAVVNLTSFTKLLASGKNPKPIYAGIYSIEAVPEKNTAGGTYNVPVIKQAGVLDDQDVDDATWERRAGVYAIVKQFSESLKDKVIETTREPGDDDFDAETLGGAAPSDQGERPPM